MVATDDGSGDGPGEPLVGRGSALRVEGGEPSVDDEGAGLRADHRGRRRVPRPSLTRSSRGLRFLDAGAHLPRARLASGLVLVVGLAVAWMWVSRGTPASEPVSIATTTTVTRAQPSREHETSIPRWVPAAIAATCAARDVEAPRSVVVDCTPGRGVVALRYRGFSSAAALRAAYDAASPRAGGDGPSRCAHGEEEERAWSVAMTPTEAAGRYRCSLVAGSARLVWSSDTARVLAIASRADGDLRSLYEWWATVPGPDGP